MLSVSQEKQTFNRCNIIVSGGGRRGDGRSPRQTSRLCWTTFAIICPGLFSSPKNTVVSVTLQFIQKRELHSEDAHRLIITIVLIWYSLMYCSYHLFCRVHFVLPPQQWCQSDSRSSMKTDAHCSHPAPESRRKSD